MNSLRLEYVQFIDFNRLEGHLKLNLNLPVFVIPKLKCKPNTQYKYSLL